MCHYNVHWHNKLYYGFCSGICNKTTLKIMCFSLLESCSPPNDIISLFCPRLNKFADPCHRSHVYHRYAVIAGKPRRVCYFTSSSSLRQSAGSFKPADINPKLCSHIIYAYATLDTQLVTPLMDNDQTSDGM